MCWYEERGERERDEFMLQRSPTIAECGNCTQRNLPNNLHGFSLKSLTRICLKKSSWRIQYDSRTVTE